MHPTRLPNLSRKLMRVFLCAALWLISSAPFRAQTGGTTEYRVVVPNDANGRILRPAETALLTVQVTNPTGAPVAGTTVWFVAPHAGSAGTFAGGYQGQNTLTQAKTDAGGVAVATFTAGSREGVFVLDALVDGASAAATFAVTVRSAVAQPALSASAVRAALVQELLAGAAESVTTHRLHGPFLLPAKTLLYSGGPESPIARTEPLATEVEAWFFWIDDDPMAGFAHGNRWVLLPASATSVTEASVLTQSWWPVARLPGSTTGCPLAQPGGSSPFLQFSNWSPVQRTSSLGWWARFAEAPADACAVLVYGPNLLGAKNDPAKFRDFLVDNNLVPAGNVFMNTVTVSGSYDPNSDIQATATPEDLKKLLDAAAAKGCRKLYLVISTHGAPGRATMGGGLQLATESIEESGFLPYEDLVAWLAPFRGEELYPILQACYSGQFALWLQGHGFRGEVAANADTHLVSWFRASGGVFGNEFLAALTNSAADSNSDGKITFYEATQYVVTNSKDPYATKSNPVAFPIASTGTRQARLPDVFMWSPGEQRFAEIRRPKSVPLDRLFMVRIKCLDRSVAESVPHDTAVPMAPGQDRIRLPIRGNSSGVTEYSLFGTDSVTGQQYTALAKVQVGHFHVDPTEVTIQLPATGTASTAVTVTRFGRCLETYKDNSTTLDVETDDEAIAGVGYVNPGKRVHPYMQHGRTETTFRIFGLRPGRTSVRVRDKLSGGVRRIAVRVLAAPPPPVTACPTAGAVNIGFTVKTDPSGHNPFVNMPPTGMIRWELLQNNSRIRIWGDVPQIVPAEGPFSHATCMGNATGFSTGPIAGFSNVQGEYLNFAVTLPAGSQAPGILSLKAGAAPRAADGPVTFDYRLGGLGEFPGGQPIVYSGSGQVDVGGCSYQLFPERTLFPSTGGSTVLWVSTTAGCNWTVTSSAAWLTIGGAASGQGFGSVPVGVQASQATARRTATLSIGQTITLIEQTAAAGDSPVISRGGVVNAGSYLTGFASGSWLAIFGEGLSSTSRPWTGADFVGNRLPTALDGVSVSINGKPAFPSHLSPGQINVLADEDPTEGPVRIVVTNGMGSSETYWAYKRPCEPEFFRFAPEDGRYIAGVHLDRTYLGRPGLIPGAGTRAARPNDIVMLFGTGFGQTEPATDHSRLISQAAPLRLPALIRIGGTVVEVLWAGIVAPGLYQFNVRIPNLPAGDHLVEAFVQGYPLQDQAYITVQP